MAAPSSWQQACIDLLASNESLHSHENAVTKQPYSVTYWCQYMDAIEEIIMDCSSSSSKNKQTDMAQRLQSYRQLRDWIGRRALALLSRSYKLWKRQWEFLMAWERQQTDRIAAPHDSSRLLKCLERALWTLHAYPRVWMLYLEELAKSTATSATLLRRTINKSLQAVAVTQHEKLWPVILAIIRDKECILPIRSVVCLLQRYSQFASLSERMEIVADYYVNHSKWQAAAQLYQQLLNKSEISGDETYQQVWSSFVTVCSQHPNDVSDIPWRDIVRAALDEKPTKQAPAAGDAATTDKAQQQVLSKGYLWTQLADSYIRQGQFELARSIYEEGIMAVDRVADFAVLFEAYLELEQGLLEAASASLEEDANSGDAAGESMEDDEDWDILLYASKDANKTNSSKLVADMEWALARAEHLTSRRPLLLNAVLLRQNPNNVQEWLTRAQLYLDQNQPNQACHTLEEALKTVDATRAVNGSPSQIVIKLAEAYEHNYEHEGASMARDLFDRICNQHVYAFRNADDLADCWVAWIEFELRQEQWDTALSLARQSVAPGPGAPAAGGKGTLRLNRSLKLWDLLLDLEESLGTVQTAKDAYNRVLEIKAATAQHVLNFGGFLIEHKYFEESFSAYERGVELFAFPNPGAKLIWKAYLKAFLDRYIGTKVERTRDLFQRCLETCPSEECTPFFLMNGEFEEEHGLLKRALSVYRRMCDKVPQSEKLTAFRLYIAKTTKYMGLTATRDIYQNAIDKLKDQDAAKICIDFFKMETTLQETERARVILAYGAQMADPRRMPEYWKEWNEFEIAHGNEETFREMLRVKRSVEAAFSTINYNAAGMSDKTSTLTDEEAMKMIASQEGLDLDQPAASTGIAGFVSAKRTAAAASLDDVEDRVAKLRKATAVSNEASDVRDDTRDDAEIDIDLDDLDAEIEQAAAEGAAAEENIKNTPNVLAETVVMRKTSEEETKSTAQGALERLRAASKAK
ncbi:hypothetical protein MPSEU_000692400 [Mayamaea pseudoterrestris]|nr:hypothetical protein MPSEU_000692400 [Mayamaea pseudoterrestris]